MRHPCYNVKEGGSLLVFSGKEYAAERTLFDTEVAPVLSAQPTGSVIERSWKPSVNEKGKRHPVTRDLPGADDKTPAWGSWLMQVDAKPLGGDVVMEGADKKPLVILDRKEKGRVATVLSDQLWLWGRGYEGGGPYLPLMQKTVQLLLRNPALEEEALRMRTDNGRLIIERQTMADKSDPMKIVAPSGKSVSLTPSQIAPGLWQASLPADELEVGLENPKMFTGSLNFTDVEGGTLVTLHNVFPSTDVRDQAIENYGAAEGGKQTLTRLAEYVQKQPTR